MYHSLPLDQFDPRHDPKKTKKKQTNLTNLFFDWFFLLFIAPTLTDDPLAPLGPGGPYRSKDNEEINIRSGLVTKADAFTQYT